MARDLAIDLGTSNLRVVRAREGIVLDQPTVVAIDASDGTVVATGEPSWQHIGGPTGSIVASHPIRHGVIVDFDTVKRMVAAVLRGLGLRRFQRARVVACVAAEASDVERRAIEEAVTGAGAHAVTLVEEPLAAAVGAGLPISDPIGTLLVDIGGGKTQAAIVALGGVVSVRSSRIGGCDLDEAIRAHVVETYGVEIGEAAAERLKIEFGSALPVTEGRTAAVLGRELASGAEREVRLSEHEIRAALSVPVARIADCVRRVLADAPPELTNDVLEAGMFLTGGGSLLRGLDLRLAQEAEVPVHLTDRPLESAVLGAGAMLERLEDYGVGFQFVRRRSLRG
mgnify:CR=1 FL=1